MVPFSGQFLITLEALWNVWAGFSAAGYGQTSCDFLLFLSSELASGDWQLSLSLVITKAVSLLPR